MLVIKKCFGPGKNYHGHRASYFRAVFGRSSNAVTEPDPNLHVIVATVFIAKPSGNFPLEDVDAGKSLSIRNLAEIIIIVAFIDAHLTMIDLKDPGNKRAQKMPVMTHQEDGAFKFLQGFEQHLPGEDVKMVGRFIENQEIQWASEEFCKHDTAPFSAREVGDTFFHLISLKQEGGTEISDDTDILHRQDFLNSFKNRMLRIQSVHGVLAEIPRSDTGAHNNIARGRFGPICDDL